MIATSQNYFVLIKDWKVTSCFKDPDLENIGKWSIMPIPGYNEETLPFFVCSGSKNYNLINVKQKTMQAIVLAGAPLMRDYEHLQFPPVNHCC